MKRLLLTLSLGALLALPLQAATPTFAPDDSCTSEGLITRLFVQIGVPEHALQIYHRFESKAGGAGAGDVYIDHWIPQGRPIGVLHETRYNNIGKNCIPYSYNQVRVFSGLSAVSAAFGGHEKSWLVASDNGNTINWPTWLNNRSTKCDGSNDNPTHICYLDANDNVCGFAVVYVWQQDTEHPVHGYQDANRIDATHSIYNYGGAWNSPSLGDPSFNGAWASWAKPVMGASLGYGWLLK